MLRAAVVAILMVGCVHADRIALATSTLTLACDWGQTRQAATMSSSRFGRYEANPILGPRPSTNEIAAYFMGAIALNAALWLITPTRYRAVAPAAISIGQSIEIASNMPQTSLCGL